VFTFHPSKSDLSSNRLSTLHKDSFRALTHLTVLDLSKNHLDFLPNDLLLDLDSLSNLWVLRHIKNFFVLNRLKNFLQCFCRRLQENKLETLDPQLFLKLRSLKILDISQNQLLSLPHELFQSIYYMRSECNRDLLQLNFVCCFLIYSQSTCFNASFAIDKFSHSCHSMLNQL
jgi:Leucine-rich repeat (LRR) protein